LAHGDHLHGYLQSVTKNPAATLLLARIIFWHKMGKGREIDGKKWTPNSYEDWATETRLSVQQVRTAFAIFKESNLAETVRAIVQHRRVLHTRPTARTIAISEGDFEEDNCSQQHDQLLPATAPSVAQTPSYIQEEIQEETQEETSGPSVPQSTPGPETECGEQTVKMSEVEQAVKARKLMHKPDTVKSLEFQWKNRVAEKTGAMIILKAKEYGQLKQFQKLCPEGKAMAVMNAVLDNWLAFVKATQSAHGLKSTPAQPSLDFLLKYAANAVIFFSLLTKPAKHEAPEVAIPTKSVQLMSQDDKPATLAEVMAILNQ
jgi:hypothetical protein